ncbi:VOC family protein [Zavarzinella formosa]|uniref:VOC family protein n=1 Tax=Zavarzinella formosa TaxID=360055 RepID=UPI0002D9458B|nr:VOC family protein [Zavarzinella formosa]
MISLETQPVSIIPHLEGQTAFSLTLHVTDVPTSVDFYRVLFDGEPAKHFHEFAEYVLAEPPLAIGLLHVNKYPGKPTNAIGLRLASMEELEGVRDRLELAGISFVQASPNRLVVSDPDDNRLDLYLANPDFSPFDHSPPATLAVREDRITWEHKICSPIPHADHSVDEITLQGTFNSEFTSEAISRLLAEVKRTLKPGTRVMVSGLVGDRSPTAPFSLPGLASRLKTLPLEHAPMTALEEAGFTDIHYELFGDIICFQAPGVDMRKIRLFGTKPTADATDMSFDVCYRGPLAEVETDDGIIFRRGETRRVIADVCRRLMSGPAAGQFSYDELP